MSRNRIDKSFILIVPYTVPQFSGSGINAFNFARFLATEGNKVTLLSFNRNMKLARKEWIDQILVRRIVYFNRNLFLKILSLFFIIPFYGSYVARHDIILIYGGHVIGYEIIILLGRWLNKKIIFQSLLYQADDIETIIKHKPKFLGNFYKNLFKKIDIYHSINTSFSEKFRNIIRKTESVLEIPQGVDISVFKPVTADIKLALREQLCIHEKNFILLSVGFLIPRKGFSGIFENLKDLDIPFTLIIAGEYDFPPGHFLSGYADSAANLIKKGKILLGKKLILTGPVKDIQNYYHAADIVLFNSVQEGLPNSLLEAMSCGIPVVTRNIHGLEAFILRNGKNCLIFNDDNAMKDHIKFLYENRDVAAKLGSLASMEIRQKAAFQTVLFNYYKHLFENRFGS